MGPPYATGSAALSRVIAAGEFWGHRQRRGTHPALAGLREIDIRTGASIRPILGFNLTSQPYRRPRSRRWRGPDRGKQLAVNGPVPDAILAEPRGLRLSRPACFRLGCGSLATRFQIARVTKSVNAKRVRNGMCARRPRRLCGRFLPRDRRQLHAVRCRNATLKMECTGSEMTLVDCAGPRAVTW